ncbi:ATP-binding protein [Streptomyces sp. NPDC059578]|uniref:ATP-binding protein n=1 Tax=Streptomyces sp. NPDC059578 TaxID=3346874 RepID=UPI0036ABDFFB
MSHLRAPAVRADRRDGARHGGPDRTPPPLPVPHLRAQLLRITVLPAVAVTLSATAAVLFTVRASAVPLGPVLRIVLAGALAVALAGIAVAAVAARRAARDLGDRLSALRRSSVRGREELRDLVAAFHRGDAPPERRATTVDESAPPAPDDEFARLAQEMTYSRETSVRAVHRAAQLSGRAGSEQKVEVFVNLARRLQSLVHREISILDELENEVEDPELLKGLFHVDHLATRIRRHAENLAVLGGAVSRRQWSSPVPLHEVLRSAIAEVEQYSRVRLVPPIDGAVRGHSVADVVHLMAELVENATVFSAPHTQVLLRVAPVTSGIAVEVEDRGLGMPVEEQARMNALLAAPDQIKVAGLLQDGRIGLLVVSQLAHRHGIAVRLQSNIYGGTQAVLVLPLDLLGPGDGGASTGARPGNRPRAGLPVGSAEPTADPTAAAATTEVEAVATRAHPHPGPAAAPRTGTVPPGPRRVGPSPSRPSPSRPSGNRPPSPPQDDGAAPLPVRDSRATRRRPSGPQPAPGATPSRRGAPTDRQAPVPGPRTTTGGQGAALPGWAVPVTPTGTVEGGGFVEERPTTQLTPRRALRGAENRPQLPKRHAQHHLVPQLREPPGPRDTDGPSTGADPGLMAAFQRGVSLAEDQHAQQVLDETAPPPGAPPTAFGPAPQPAAFGPAPASAPGGPAAALLPADPTHRAARADGPTVLTALDVPAHELPTLTRTPIHDLALSAFTANHATTPPTPTGQPARPDRPTQGPAAGPTSRPSRG